VFKDGFADEEIHGSFLEVLDIVIKWAYIKSNEISNIAFLKELYIFFEDMLDFLISKEYQFMEAEGLVFCLCLVEKVGMNNAILKEKIKEILIKLANSTVYYPKKIMGVLIKGLSSKNTKTVAECLECIAVIMQAHQLEVINEKDVKLIAVQCESSDNGIRQSALFA
jgi:cytoskeleton-associated protein 5